MNDCPYTIYCKPECEMNYLKCLIYQTIENNLIYQQRKARVNRRVYRMEHGHKRYEELPNFSGEQPDISLIVQSLMDIR